MIKADIRLLLRGIGLYRAINLVIALVLLSKLLANGHGSALDSEKMESVQLSMILLVWFALSYLSYRRVSFERWCGDRGRLSIGDWYRALSAIVETSYRPMVRLLESPDEVSLAARDLISDKANAPIFLNGKVVFLGAAANQSDRSRRESLVISEDSERTPAQVYQGAVEEAMSKLHPIYRIISLLTPEEFSSRSLEKRRQYISWISNQIAQLKRNKNYILLDNRRAPKWGAAGAAIFSSRGYFQFTSASGRALFVRDEWLSRHMMRAIMANLGAAKKENKFAYTQMEREEINLYSTDGQFGQSLSASDLDEVLVTLNARVQD
jgi:hypothetical protein